MSIDFLKNAALMNQAMDQIDMVSGIPSSDGRIPIYSLARAIQGSVTLNNLTISQSQVGVLNTGSIEKIDAAITPSRGSDAEEISQEIKALTEAIAASEELDAAQKNEVLELTESLAEEIVGRQKKATMAAVLQGITDKVRNSTILADAAARVWDAFKSMP